MKQFRREFIFHPFDVFIMLGILIISGCNNSEEITFSNIMQQRFVGDDYISYQMVGYRLYMNKNQEADPCDGVIQLDTLLSNGVITVKQFFDTYQKDNSNISGFATTINTDTINSIKYDSLLTDIENFNGRKLRIEMIKEIKNSKKNKVRTFTLYTNFNGYPLGPVNEFEIKIEVLNSNENCLNQLKNAKLLSLKYQGILM